ncbi:ATP-binding cassette domain-containing protein [Streptomyces sp. MK37H]|uniref:ATP-binding cassette domain-containing protein n=1 Tax=Streptomyces sp. MK37H TaxID=2699117 RepID=UPI002491B26A|nr:ATP-binding cassette domain-containing protein [Streptomyces sp. MK37H]
MTDPLLEGDRPCRPLRPPHHRRQGLLRIHAGETLALVGASGCGKSSTALATPTLRRPEGGSVRFEGRELTGLRGAGATSAAATVPAGLPGPPTAPSART